MTIKAMIPKPVDVGREALVVIAGALVAALVIGYLPGVRDWIKAQWAGNPDAPASDTPWI